MRRLAENRASLGAQRPAHRHGFGSPEHRPGHGDDFSSVDQESGAAGGRADRALIDSPACRIEAQSCLAAAARTLLLKGFSTGISMLVPGGNRRIIFTPVTLALNPGGCAPMSARSDRNAVNRREFLSQTGSGLLAAAILAAR